MNERLKLLRAASGKSQRDFAKLLGVGFRSWQGYENGSNKPGADVLKSLSNLGYNINWLLMGEGDMRIVGSLSTASELSIQVQPVVDAVIEVMTSDHAGVKLALTQNALMFQEMVRNAKKLDKLEKKVDDLERHQETDFKTQESRGEDRHQDTQRAGGK